MARPGPLPEIGVIAALPVEAVALEHVLGDVVPAGATDDPNRYLVAHVSGRPVVLTCLATSGNTAAADACANLCRSFPSVRALVMCGIALGVPHPGDPERHVRLGDIVVGTEGVAHYGHRRVTEDGSLPRDPPIPAARRLLRCVRELQAGEFKGRRPWESWLARPPSSQYTRPAGDSDRLVDHRHPPRPASGHRPGLPKVHYGRIGSGDELLRNARRRDEIAGAERVLAIEMEGAGIAASALLGDRGCLVVRGISDYGDRAKSDRWQPYAALAAAAYVRALLEVEAEVSRPLEGAESSMPSGDRSAGRALFEIVALMERVPVLRTGQGRDVVLGELGPPISVSVSRSPTARMDLFNIVDTCLNHPNGLDALLEILTFFEGDDSLPLRDLAAAVSDLRDGHRP